MLDTLTEQKAEANLRKMVEQKLIADKKILFADVFTGFQYADIEDLFSKKDYLRLYNGALAKSIRVDQLDDTKGILGQLIKQNGNRDFNHCLPSRYMMEHIGELKFEGKTIDKFEEVFKAVNKLLKTR